VGVALTGLAVLAVGTSRRQARDSRRVAPTRLSPVLDLEKPPAHRTTRCANRRSCAHPRTVNRESPLGCAPGFTASCRSWESLWVSRPSRSSCDGIRARHHKRGGPSSPITRANWWPPTCSSCRRSRSGCYSCWSSSDGRFAPTQIHTP